MSLVCEVLADPEALADRAAGLLAEAMRAHPRGLFCLAAGDTPRLTYQKLTVLLKGGIDTGGLRFVALDEWRGLAPDAPGGCRAFLGEAIFEPLGIEPSQIAFFDAQAPDTAKECLRLEAWIADEGPIVVAVLGIGRNGHLGFNEPGSTADSRTRLVDLDATTQRVGVKYFPGRVPSQGMTLGLGTLLKAHRILVLATGEEKADIVQAALDPARFPEVPAAVLTRHPDARLLVDRSASSLAQPLSGGAAKTSARHV